MEDYLVKETIEAMKIHLAEYLNTVWKTFAALMVSIGWFISSDSARNFVSANFHIQIAALLIVFFMALLHLGTLLDLYKKSLNAKSNLGSELEPLLLSVVDSYSIPMTYPLASFFINGLLYISLMGLIIIGV